MNLVVTEITSDVISFSQKSLQTNASIIAQGRKPAIKDVAGSAPAESTAAEHKVLSIKSDDFPGTEQKLNQEGAAGSESTRPRASRW